MIKMYKTEGLPAFWKGILPPILVETPKRAVKASIYYLMNMQNDEYSITYEYANRSLTHVLSFLYYFYL